MTNPEIDQVLDAWLPHINAITDWESLVRGLDPKPTGCGPVYELENPIANRQDESFAIADMRDVLVAEPHYHPNRETEIYVVLTGLGNVVVGGKENKVGKGSVIVTPPDTTHFTIPERDLVLAVINTPSFNPANYVPITNSDPAHGFDTAQLTRLVEASYQRKGLTTEYGRDEPGKMYAPHRHEMTYLYTISGSIVISLDGGEPKTVSPHQEFVVGSGQLHEAVVAPDGWEYVAAFDSGEAARYTHA